MDVSGYLCFCPFSEHERKPPSLFIELILLWTCSDSKSRSWLKSAFSLPKENMCMFKALWKGMSFPFREPICPTMSTHHQLSIKTGPSSKSYHDYLYNSVYSRDKDKARDVTLCQTLTPLGWVLEETQGTFCRSLQTMTGRLPLLFVTFIFLCFDQVKTYLLLGIMGNHLPPIDVQTCLSVLAEHVCVWACVTVCAFVCGHECVRVCVCVHVCGWTCGPCVYM